MSALRSPSARLAAYREATRPYRDPPPARDSAPTLSSPPRGPRVHPFAATGAGNVHRIVPGGIMPTGWGIRWQQAGGHGDGTFVAIRGLRPARRSSGSGTTSPPEPGQMAEHAVARSEERRVGKE